jgi:hypothetical protein
MRKQRRTLLLGTTLVLLLTGGLVAAVLWPTLSEADRRAALYPVGMIDVHEPKVSSIHWLFDDRSRLEVTFAPKDGQWRVDRVRTWPPSPVHPLTRLRRTLALIIPALGE